MKNVSRRAMFMTIAGGALALATGGCVTSKSGNTTTITVNVAKINAYVEAASNAGIAMSNFIKTIPIVAGYGDQLKLIVDTLASTSAEFNAAVKGEVTVSFDDTNIQTMVTSLFSLFQQLAQLIKTILATMSLSNKYVSVDTVNRMELIYSALVTLISVLRATLFPSYVKADVTSYTISERQALQTLSA